jgi:hypothetical protein
MASGIVERFRQAQRPSLSGAGQFQRQKRLQSGAHGSDRWLADESRAGESAKASRHGNRIKLQRSSIPSGFAPFSAIAWALIPSSTDAEIAQKLSEVAVKSPRARSSRCIHLPSFLRVACAIPEVLGFQSDILPNFYASIYAAFIPEGPCIELSNS